MRGPDVVGVRSTPWAWVLLGLALLGVVVAVAAAIGVLASWVAALVSTAQQVDRPSTSTWALRGHRCRPEVMPERVPWVDRRRAD
jgi:hypothetical protein